MKNKKIILIILISLSLFGLFVYSLQTINKNSPPPNLPLIKVEETKYVENSHVVTTLEINGQRYEDEIATEMSVYDFMSKLRNEGRIDFIEKNYTGIGKFIVSINGVSGDGSRNWIYYVNGIEAQVGVSNYKIKNGDIISWKYEKSNY